VFGPAYGVGEDFERNVAVAEETGVSVIDAVVVALGTVVEADGNDAMAVKVGAGMGVDVEQPATALMLQIIIMS